MGIQGLLGTCLHNADATSDIYDLVAEAKKRDGMKILVDFFAFCFSVLSEKINDLVDFESSGLGINPFWKEFFGGEYDLVDNLMKRLIQKFWENNIDLVFFIDGGRGSDLDHFQQKFDTWCERDINRAKSFQDVVDRFHGYQSKHNPVHGHYVPSPVLLKQQVLTALHHDQVEVIYCRGEADDVMAEYMVSDDKAFAILGNDSDFCVMKGARFIPFELFDLDKTFHRIWNTNMALKSLKVGVITPAKVTQFLKLASHAELVDVCILRGNDFSKPFVETLCVQHRSFIKTVEMFKSLTAEKEKKLESIDEVWELMNSNDRFRSAVEYSRQFYGVATGNVASSTPKPKRWIKSEADRTPSCVSLELDEYLEKRIAKGDLRDRVLSLRNGIYWYRLVFEEMTMGKPGIERSVVSLRKVLCGMLRVKEITEYGRTADDNRFKSLKVMCPPLPYLPAVNEVDSISVETRYKLFDRVMCELGEDLQTCSPCALTRGPSFFDSMATKDAFSAYALNHLLCLNQKYKFNITPTEFLILAAMTFSGGTKPTCAPEKKFKYKQVNPVLRSLIIGGSWFQKVVDWTHFLAQFLQISEEFPEPKDIYIGRYFILYYHWIIEGRKEVVSQEVVGKLWNIVQNNSLLSAGVKRIFRDCLNKFHFVEEADGNEDCSIDGAEEEEALLADDIGEFDEDPQDILHPDSEGIEELPILKYRDIVIEHIATHRVTCIEGETGSGKSTQVPQFILDDYRTRGVGRKPSIIVTQPRRMAAKTLAERVARERHTTLGTEVGYKIGQDYQASKNTSILFVTTGFIIRALVHDPARLKTFTHLILDEVHVRELESDMLCLIIKLLTQNNPDIKIVLMSATIQGDLFLKYFAKEEEIKLMSQASIFVGTKRYPVELVYLENINQRFGSDLTSFQKVKLATRIMKYNQTTPAHYLTSDDPSDQPIKEFLLELKDAHLYNAVGKRLAASKEAKGSSVTDLEYDLALTLIRLSAVPGESILVFLPGKVTIEEFFDLLLPFEDRKHRGWKCPIKLFALHSMIPFEDQLQAFQPPPPDVAHVIIATNVAESSLTLPKVRVVLDFGRRKQIVYRPKYKMRMLESLWCSKASMEQRKGRAGRVFPGVCIRMFTKKHYDMQAKYDMPQMRISPLEKIVLEVKFIGKKIAPELRPTELLLQTIEPPDIDNIYAAIEMLANLGAIEDNDENASITTLGMLDMRLPVNLHLTCVIMFGVLFDCPCDGIIMAASLQAKDPFTMPTKKILKEDAQFIQSLHFSSSARNKFDRGYYSEPIMLRQMFLEWLKTARRGQEGRNTHKNVRADFCHMYHVDSKRLGLLENLVQNLATCLLSFLPEGSKNALDVQMLLDALNQKGKIQSQDTSRRVLWGKGRKGVAGHLSSEKEWLSIFSKDMGLLQTILTAGLSPMVAFGKVHEGEQDKEGIRRKALTEAMKKAGVDPTTSVALVNPPTIMLKKPDFATQILKKIADPDAVRFIASGNIILDYSNAIKASNRGVIRDIPLKAHLLYQFGEGNRTFLVEMPEELNASNIEQQESECDDTENGSKNTDHSNETFSSRTELRSPKQPYRIIWTILSTAGAPLKTPGVVCQALPCWRNPIGFSCDTAMQEHYGVFYNFVSGSKSSAWVEGFTALPCEYDNLWAMVLLLTFHKCRYGATWKVDVESGRMVSATIFEHEMKFTKKHPLTHPILLKINEVRQKVSGSLEFLPNVSPLLKELHDLVETASIAASPDGDNAIAGGDDSRNMEKISELEDMTMTEIALTESAGDGSERLEKMDTVNPKTSSSKRTKKKKERKRKDTTTVTVNAFAPETGVFTYLVPYDTRVFDETYIKTLRETMKTIQPCSALASDALKKLAALEGEEEREEDHGREYLHKASEDELLDCIIAVLELHKPPTNTASFKELSRTPSVKRLADQLRGQSFGDFSWQRFFDKMIKQGLLHVTLDKEGEDVVVQLPTSDIMLQGQPSSRNLAQQDVLDVTTAKNGEDEAVALPVSDIVLQGQPSSVEFAEQDMLGITYVKTAGDAVVDIPASDVKQGQLSSEELSQLDLLDFAFVKNAEDSVVDLSPSRTMFQGKPQLEGMAKQDMLNVTLVQNGENAAIVERPSSCTMLEEYGQLGTLTEVSSALNNQYHADLAKSIESVLQTSRSPVTLSCLKKHPDVGSHLFLVIEHEPSYTLTKCIEEHGHLFRMVKIWNTEAVCLNKAEDTDCANVTPIVTLSDLEGATEPTIQSSTLTVDPSGPSQFHDAKRAHIQVEYKKHEKGGADAAGALVMEEDREDKRIGIKASGAPAVETHRKCDVKVSAMLHMEQKIKDEKKLKAHASKISCMTPHGPDLNDEKDEAAGLPTVEAQMKDENTKREVTFVSSVPSQGLGFGGGKSALPVSPRHFGLGVKETCIVPGSEMQTGMTNETHTDHSAFDQEKYILTQQIVEHLSQVKEPVLLSALGTVPSVRCIVLSIRAKHKKGFKLKDHLLENNQFLLSHVKGADFVQIKDVKRMQGVSAVPPLEKKMKDEEKIKAHVTIKQFMTPGSGLNFENDEAYVAGALVMEEDREDGRTGIEASAAPAVETQGKCDVRFSEMPYMEKNNNSKEKLKAHATVMSCMTSHGSDLNDEKDEAAGPPTVEAQMKDVENTMREVTIVPSQGLGFDGGKSKGNSVEAPKEEIQRIDDIKPKKKVTMVPYVKPQDQMVNGNNKVDAAHATKIPWMIPHGSDLNDEKDIAAGPPTVKVQMKDDENTKREVTVVSSVPSQGLGFDGGQSEGKAAETTAVEKQRIDDIKPEKKVTVIPCVQLSESPGQSADAPQPSALPVSPGGPSQFVFDVKEACIVTGSEIQTGFKNETHRDHSAFDQEKFTLTQQIVEHLLQVEEPVSLSTLGTVPSVRCILLSIKAKYEKNFKLKNHLLENNQFLLSRVKDIDFVQMKNIKYILTREIVEHLSKVKEPVLLSALGTVPSVRCILLSLRAKHKKNFKLKDHLLENNQFLVSQVKGVDFVQMKDVIGRKQGVSAVPDMENKMKDEEKLKAHATPHGPDLNDEKDEAAAPPTRKAQMKDDENAMSEVTIVSNVPSQGLGFDGGKSKGNSDETPTIEKQSIGDVKQKKKVTMVPYVKPQDQVVNGNNKVDAANLVTVKTLPMNHEPPVGARLKETGQLLDEDYQYFAQLVKRHLSRWEQDSYGAMTLSQLEEKADIREQLKLMREKCSAGLELRTIFRRLGKTFALDDNGALRFTRACIQKEAYERDKQLLTQLVKSHVTATILPISLEVLAQQADIERQLKKMEIYKTMKYTHDENIDLVDVLGGCGDTFEVIESKKKFLVRLSSAEVKTNAESFEEDKIRLGLLVKNHLLETGTGGPMKLVELCQKADVKEKLLFMKAKYNRNDLNLLHILSIFGEVFVLQKVDQMEAVRLTKSALRKEKEVLDTKLLKIANRK